VWVLVQVEKEAFHLVSTEELPDSHTFKLDKTKTWQDVVTEVERIAGVPAAEQLYFFFTERRNSTQRPNLLFNPAVRSYTL
jgi:hypothetical protein